MSQTLAVSTSRLCGLAARALGWRPDEFWRATPAELAASTGCLTDGASSPATRADLNRMMEHDRAR